MVRILNMTYPPLKESSTDGLLRYPPSAIAIAHDRLLRYPLKQIITACSNQNDGRLLQKNINPDEIRTYYYNDLYKFDSVTYLENYFPYLRIDTEVPCYHNYYYPVNFPLKEYIDKIKGFVDSHNTVIVQLSNDEEMPKQRYTKCCGKFTCITEYFDNDLVPITQTYAIVYPKDGQLCVISCLVKSYVDFHHLKGVQHKDIQPPTLDHTIKTRTYIVDPIRCEVQISLHQLLELHPTLIDCLGATYSHNMLFRSIRV